MSTLYVFRTIGGRGFEQGPRIVPPPEISNKVKRPDLSKARQTVLSYDDDEATRWIAAELFEHGRLRQGWGVPGLDLRQRTPAQWISEYMEAAWRYWGTPADESSAYGRYEVLIVMHNLQPSVDVVFIPNMARHGLDRDCFTVATVAGRYWFDQARSSEPDTWRKDFGHVIPITRPITYKRSQYPLDFRAPYLRAINHIERTHKRYATFRDFRGQVYGWEE